MSTVKTTNITHSSNSGTANIVLDSSGNITGAGNVTSTGNVTVGNELHATPSGNANANGFSIIPADGTTASHVKILGNSNSGGASGRNGGVTYIDANYYLTSSTIFDISARGTSRFNITGDGKIYFNTSSSAPNPGFYFDPSGGQCSIGNNAGTSGQSYFEFRRSTTQIGSVTQSGTTGVSFNTSSDYRLKENQVAISDGITRLKTLKPYRFNFKAEPSITVDGFFAHEVTAVPEAVVGTKDKVDEDNKPIYQQIDQSKLVPLLTAALQEAITKIDTLETKVAALESG